MHIERKKMKKAWAAIFASAIVLFFSSAEAEEKMLAVWMDGKLQNMSEESYLIGVVAAEMPALYEIEALKAQAVAARTLTEKGCLTYPEADVCTESGCCQAYWTEKERKERWQENCGEYEEKIARAVTETRREILTWQGEAILSLFHAVSGGQTEDVEAVYTQFLPYLRSVVSPGEEEHAAFQTHTVFSSEQLRSLLPDAFEGCEVSFEVLQRSESGRILSIRAGRLLMDGRTLRSALGLKSTNVEIERQGDEWVFLQKGYGHGVGMSQAGAQAMAKQGADYREILAHYYIGAEIEKQ